MNQSMTAEFRLLQGLMFITREHSLGNIRQLAELVAID
jgi:hypothetical protein